MNINDNYNFLNKIVTNDYLHAKFLNTLSFLEYTGARKIVKSQDEKELNFEKLSHMSEEIRHALMFKKFSHKLCSNGLDYNEKGIFCYEVSRSYIKKIDDFCMNLMEKDLCYPVVSYIIEVRAIDLYRFYADVLERNGIKLSLKSLIYEEENHLKDMEEVVSKSIDQHIIDSVRSFEAKLFSEFNYKINLELNDESTLSVSV